MNRRSDRNADRCSELLKLAQQKPRYEYRRPHTSLAREGQEVNVKRMYWLYVEESLIFEDKEAPSSDAGWVAGPRLK